MKHIIETAFDIEDYIQKFEKVAAETTNLEICCKLGQIFMDNRHKYTEGLDVAAREMHRDLHQNFPEILLENLCYYVGPFFAEACRLTEVGEVYVVKGHHMLESRMQVDPSWKLNENSGLYEKIWRHHWNYDAESKQWIDIKMKKLVLEPKDSKDFAHYYLWDGKNMRLEPDSILGYPIIQTFAIACGYDISQKGFSKKRA
ncbi:MAG: hypothetical protein ACMXYG_02940 [Candidatus Woesearchaeota archaeon]